MAAAPAQIPRRFPRAIIPEHVGIPVERLLNTDLEGVRKIGQLQRMLQNAAPAIEIHSPHVVGQSIAFEITPKGEIREDLLDRLNASLPPELRENEGITVDLFQHENGALGIRVGKREGFPQAIRFSGRQNDKKADWKKLAEKITQVRAGRLEPTVLAKLGYLTLRYGKPGQQGYSWEFHLSDQAPAYRQLFQAIGPYVNRVYLDMRRYRPHGNFLGNYQIRKQAWDATSERPTKKQAEEAIPHLRAVTHDLIFDGITEAIKHANPGDTLEDILKSAVFHSRLKIMKWYDENRLLRPYATRKPLDKYLG